MKRGPSISKILDTRNRKAVKLRFDVRAERTWLPVVSVPESRCRQCGSLYHDKCDRLPRVKRYDDDLPMTSDWMA